MSVESPETVQEWAEYIATLHGEDLWGKAVAANTLEFVQTLQEEGYGPQEITDVLVLFALQFGVDQQAPPVDMDGQYLSYPELLTSWGSRFMRRRAYSMNAGKTPLKEAKAFAESKLGAEVVAEKLPDFDKNYNLIQKKVKAAPGIPRIKMPVIEPDDIAEFNQRLNEGRVDIFAPYAKGKLIHPKDLSREDGSWIELGFKDGNPSDDQVKAKHTSISVGKLKPTQNQIWVENIVGPMSKWGVPGPGSPILKATVIVSGDNYILDGHHRWAQATLVDPNMKMNALKVPLNIKQLLEVGRDYGEAIGNKPKQGSLNLTASDRTRLVKLAQTLPQGDKQRRAILSGLRQAAPKDWSVRWMEFNRKDQRVNRQKEFPSEKAMEKFMAKQEKKDNFDSWGPISKPKTASAQGFLQKAVQNLYLAQGSIQDHFEGLGEERSSTREYRRLQQNSDQINKALVLLEGVRLS